MVSGCQSLRHSSMKVGFCVQRDNDMVISPVTQILQPMHSRMSSTRPSSILRGSHGSAIEGLAQPIKSSRPELSCRTMTSGEVKRPTPTTGLLVSDLIPLTRSCCAASGLKREVAEQSSHAPCARSHKSGSSPQWPIRSCTSLLEKPSSPTISSSDKRTVTAMLSPISSLASAINSRRRRARFSSDPPYSSVRWLVSGDRKC